jgi:uncharacterized membrane protein
MSYDVLRLLHLLGVVLLLGNVTVTSDWKLYADRTRDPVVIAFAQRLVTITDWFFTFWGSKASRINTCGRSPPLLDRREEGRERDG